MKKLKAAVPYFTAAVIGGAVWLTITHVTGRREAWDSVYYWKIGYPILLACGASLGYVWPHKRYRLALIMMLVQPVTIFIQGFADGDRMSFSLLPIGLVLFAVLALPGLLCAKIGAVLRGRFGAGHANRS